MSTLAGFEPQSLSWDTEWLVHFWLDLNHKSLSWGTEWLVHFWLDLNHKSLSWETEKLVHFWLDLNHKSFSRETSALITSLFRYPNVWAKLVCQCWQPFCFLKTCWICSTNFQTKKKKTKNKNKITAFIFMWHNCLIVICLSWEWKKKEFFRCWYETCWWIQYKVTVVAGA